MSEEPLDEGMKQFEADLASLKPHVEGTEPGWAVLLARVAGMEANRSIGPTEASAARECPCCGARGGRGHRLAWPLAFSAMTALATGFALALLYTAEARLAQPEKSFQEVPRTSSPHPDMAVVPENDLPNRQPLDLDWLASDTRAGEILSVHGVRPHTATGIEVARASAGRLPGDPPSGGGGSVHASRRLLNEILQQEHEGG